MKDILILTSAFVALIFMALLLPPDDMDDYTRYFDASWYSLESLHTAGQWRVTHGIMANGEPFDDTALTCASWDYPLGTRLLVTNRNNDKDVEVVVTDRMNRRFQGERIDLSLAAFKKIAKLKDGIITVDVVELK